MANERVLVTFEGRDKGLVSTAKDAAEAVRRIQFDLERLRKRAPTLDIFKNSLASARKLLSQLQQDRDIAEQLIKAGQRLTAEQKRRYDIALKQIPIQSKTVRNLERIVRLRQEENIKWEQQLQIAKQIQSLEARSASARDPNVTRARIASEADKARQDEIVNASVNSLLGKQGIFSAISQFVSGGQSAAATFAALQGAVSGFSIASTAAAGAAGILSLQMKTLQLGARGLAKAFQAVVIGITGYFRMLGSIVSVQVRAAGAVGSFIKRLWESHRAHRETRREIEQSNGAIRAYGNNLRGLVGTVNNLNRGINIFGASIRQIGQAVQNAGVLLTIYFSLPASQLLKGITDVSLELNDVLVEIQKNTGLATEEVQGFVRDGIEALSSFTPTDIIDIGKIVSDAAKSGVPEQFLLPFTQVVDQLAVATDIMAEDATTALARIINIFYDLEQLAAQGGDEFLKVVTGVGSAIAKLGAENALFESEIVSATLRLAPAARALRLEVYEALALAATVVQTSASAKRAGTQASSLLVSLGIDIEKFAAAVGLSSDELSDMIDQDAIGTLNRYADLIANLSSNTERLAAQNELAGRVGGKAFGTLTSGSNKLLRNLTLAEQAFVKGTALQIEFDRATTSVANQIKILRNNLKVLGVTLGDSVLPLLTEAISYAIPFVQALTQYIRDFTISSEEASRKLRLWVVGLIAFTAIIGPLSYALGSLLFQIGIFTTGFTGIASLLGRIASGPLSLIAALIELLTPLRAAIVFFGLAAGAMIYFGSTSQSVASGVVSAFRGMGDFVIGIFTNIINSVRLFVSSVFSIITDFVRGLARALQNFAIFTDMSLDIGKNAGKNAIKGIEEGASDAKDTGKKIGEDVGEGISERIEESTEGTLQDAFNLASKFGQSFVNGLRSLSPDILDMFDTVFSEATSIFTDFAAYFSIDSETVSGELEKIAGMLLDAFGGMGDGLEAVSGLFEGLRPYIGSFVDDLQKLYDNTVKYNRAQERLIELQERLRGFDRETTRQITALARRSDLSVTERANRIRFLKQQRAEEKVQLEDQIEDQEKAVDKAREEVDAQQQLINVLQKLIPTRDSVASKKDDEGTVLGDIGAIGSESVSGIGDLEEAINGANKSFESFADTVQRTRDFVLGFLSGLLGENLFVEGYEPVWEAYFEGWEAGEGRRNQIEKWFEDQEKRFGGLITLAKGIGNAFAFFGAGVQTGFNGETVTPGGKPLNELTPQEFASFSAGIAIGNTGAYLDELFGILIEQIFGDENPGEALGNKLTEALNTFLGSLLLNSEIAISIERIADAVRTIVTNIGKLAGFSFDNIPTLADGIATVIDSVLKGSAKFIEFVAALTDVVAFLTGNATSNTLLDSLQKIDKSNKLYQTLLSGKAISDATGQSQLKTLDFASLGGFVGEAISNFLASVFEKLKTDRLTDVAAAIVNFLLGVISEIDPESVGELFSAIPNAIIEALGKIDQETLSSAATALVESFLAIGDAINFAEASEVLFNIASALATALSEADWSRLTRPINEIATSILEGLGGFDWKTLSTGFANIVNSIVDALDDPTLWTGTGEAFANFSQFVVDTLAGLEWATLTTAIFDGLVTAVITAIQGINWGSVFLGVQDIFGSMARGFVDFMLSNMLSILGLGTLNRQLFGTGRSGNESPIAPNAGDVPPPDVRLTQFATGNLTDEDWIEIQGYAKAIRGEIILSLLESINPANWFKGLFSGKEDELPEDAKNSNVFKNLLSSAGNAVSALFGLGSSDDLAQKTLETFTAAANTATPSVRTEASTLGTTAGSGFVSGFEGEVEGKNAWVAAIYEGISSWIGNNEPVLIGAGFDVYGIVSGAISTNFIEGVSYLDSIKTGLASWIVSNITKLEGYGRVIGEKAEDGMYNVFSRSSVFDALLRGFGDFIIDEGAQIYDWFYKFGQQLWDALAQGFAGNQINVAKHFRDKVLPSILPDDLTASTGIPRMPAYDPNNPPNDPTIDSVIPSQSSLSAGTTINMNVVIQGQTARDANELADKLFKLLERRLKNPR